MLPFEQDNLKAYTLLLRIEVAIRECLRKHLEESIGFGWYKHLPGDLLKKTREAQKEEYRPQFNFRRMGPLYYLTLGELLPILTQKLGQPVAERFGGANFTTQLENALAPRNALSHSRDVTPTGLKAIEALYAQIETSLTPDGLDVLLANPDVGLSLSQACSDILPPLRQALAQLTSLPASLPVPPLYGTACRQFWWDDPVVAGFDSAPVDAAIKALSHYNALPQGIGSAAQRQRFLEDSKLTTLLAAAVNEVQKVSA